MSYQRSFSPDMIAALPKSGFRDVQVLVVGDLMLDQYVDGDVQRISPEAPVPVVSVRKRRAVPGGAANVALNILGLEAKVSAAGVIGEDPPGKRLTDLFTQSGVNAACVVKSSARPTTSKTRIISGNHQIVRLDEETADDLDDSCSAQLMQSLTGCLNRGDIGAVILSDYGKGVLAGDLPQWIIEECRRRGIPVLVDPKRQDYSAYRGATCVTPNQKEFHTALIGTGINAKDFAFAGLAFREQLQCTALLVTQGAEGMTLFTPAGAKHLSAMAEEVFDVSGAGDTVIATLGVAVGSGLSFENAVELANIAASIVVRHAGTTPIAWRELSEVLGLESMPQARSANTFSAGAGQRLPD
jgi:D-beta-D-heptose 7-phosphate kinase/D-beta-D-heptose 1-phosphate adenosyltransferase